MATLGSPSSPSSPRRRRSLARRIERCCCTVATFFPLVFVYGLTTWAVWVELKIGFTYSKIWRSHLLSTIGLIFYLLLNWSYTTAVFTDPGSPLEVKNGGYSNIPTHEHRSYSSFTVKASGDIRFCKKCQTQKPDRAHHCSTCRRCVLKMDHHCPWLATCVGLRNYKAFLLFLIYVSLFCWTCFAIAGPWVYNEMLAIDTYNEALMPVNFILLAVISGLIGIVISGFTGWHLYLAARNTTTIEKLEKTRYLSPLRRTMQHHLSQRNPVDPVTGRPSFGDQLREMHANVLPGITRQEEGEDARPLVNHSSTPAQSSLHRNYLDMEAQRERDRYAEYLDEVDSSKLPHAFDLGAKQNYIQVFGKNPLLWPLPICNSIGDGWQWHANEDWILKREQIRHERETEITAQRERERAAGWGVESPTPSPWVGTRPAWANKIDEEDEGEEEEPVGKNNRFLTTSNGVARIPLEGRRSPSKADQILGRYGSGRDEGISMQNLDRRRRTRSTSPAVDNLFEDDDDDELDGYDQDTELRTFLKKGPSTSSQTDNWNDLPADMVGRKSPRKAPTKDKRAKGEQEWESWSPR